MQTITNGMANNQALLYRTGNYNRSPGRNHNGRESKKGMYIGVQLSHSAV